MSLPNLSGSNIQDTYQRVLHTDGSSIFDGTGSTILSSIELSSLQTMNNNTISNADWTYVESMDQHVNTTASVQFSNITCSNVTASSGIYFTTESFANITANESVRVILENTNETNFTSFIVHNGITGGNLLEMTDYNVLKLGAGDYGATIYTDGHLQFTVDGDDDETGTKYFRWTTGETPQGTELAKLHATEGFDIWTNINTTSHITASGNISASGTSHVFGGTIDIAQNDYSLRWGDGSTRITGDSLNDTLKFRTNSLTRVMVDTKGLSVTGHITASSNISASGEIKAEHFYSSDEAAIENQLTVGRLLSVGSITSSANISASNSIIGGELSTEGLMRSKTAIISNTDTGATVNINDGQITASSHISSSGDIKANTFAAYATTGNNTFETHILLSTDKSIAFGGTTTKVTGDNTTLQLDGTHIFLNAPVTASSKISSSTTIAANNFVGSGAALTNLPNPTVDNTTAVTSHPIVFIDDTTPDGSTEQLKAHADVWVKPSTGLLQATTLKGTGLITVTGSSQRTELGPGPTSLIADNTAKSNYNLWNPQGYLQTVFITPSQFIASDVTTTGRDSQPTMRSGKPVLIAGAASQTAYYQYVIPSGVQVTHVDVYANAGTFAVKRAFIGNNAFLDTLLTSTAVNGNNTTISGSDGLGAAESTIFTGHSLSPIVSSSFGTDFAQAGGGSIFGIGQYITILWTSLAASDTLYGASITIKPIE